MKTSVPRTKAAREPFADVREAVDWQRLNGGATPAAVAAGSEVCDA